MFVAWSQWVAIVRHKPSQDRTEPGRAVAIHPPATLRLVVMRRASTIHRTELARATLHAARVASPLGWCPVVVVSLSQAMGTGGTLRARRSNVSHTISPKYPDPSMPTMGPVKVVV